MMDYPAISLAYLRTITDCTGVIQHGTHSVPNRKLGYTTDDNARALIIAIKHYERTKERQDLDLALTYLSYLHYAQNPDFKFRNVMSYQRNFLDDEGTEDCYGRTMWACGYTASSDIPENMRVVAKNLFESSIVWAGDLKSPRARAYTMVGMCEFLRANEDPSDLRGIIKALADTLLAGLRAYGSKDWYWYEPYMTYGNAILPLGMLVAAQVTGNKAYRNAAIDTMQFLTDTIILNDCLEIIGNDGWYIRGKKRAYYDQQSIDAGYTVNLYVQAYKHLGDKKYADLAHIANSWFFGNNRNRLWVYDPKSNGCCDGITPSGVNLNQGSESCISMLLAQLAMQDLQDQQELQTIIGTHVGRAAR